MADNPKAYGDKIPQNVAQLEAEGLLPITWVGGKKRKTKPKRR